MTTDLPVTQDDLMARSGARWCETHDRWECSANKADHHASAIRGMRYCKNHTGRSLAMSKALGEANLAAWSTAEAAADAAPLDTGRVVMDQLRVAVIRADLYGELLRWQLQVEDEAGLVGPTYAMGRDGTRVETGEAVRGLARVEAEWRDRVVRFAKVAHDMGIDERQVELEQAQATQVVAAVKVALEAAALAPEVQDVFVRSFLGALGRGAETAAGADAVVAGEVLG